MYDDGRAVPQDYAEAVKWYRKAAGQGDAGAQNNLGVMYKNGRGVPQDYVEALQWYRKAAEQGNAEAQGNLVHRLIRSVHEDMKSTNVFKLLESVRVNHSSVSVH